MLGSASELRASGWLIALPALDRWLDRLLAPDSALPAPSGGSDSLAPARCAPLATFVLSGTIATSPLWIGPTINQNATAFGAFGAVIALFAYILIGTTLSMVCAVFAPVWAEWRQGEHERKEPGGEPSAVRLEVGGPGN